MKAKIFDIKHYAIHDGPGIRTTVFFSGCPLSCLWCQNPEALFNYKTENESFCNSNLISNFKEYTVNELFEEIIKDEIFFDESGGGVTFSGGEPMMQGPFLKQIIEKCKTYGIHTCVDTTGYCSKKIFDDIYENVDIFLFDLKLMDDEKHVNLTGVSNLTILENLIHLTNKGRKVKLRIPLIPRVTDTSENLEMIGDFISKLKNVVSIDLLPYNKISEDKYERLGLNRQLPKMTEQTEIELLEIKNKFIRTGFEINIRG